MIYIYTKFKCPAHAQMNIIACVRAMKKKYKKTKSFDFQVDKWCRKNEKKNEIYKKFIGLWWCPVKSSKAQESPGSINRGYIE